MGAVAVRDRAEPTIYMQGVAVPQSQVNPAEFFKRTRRKIQIEKQVPYVGQDQETFQLRKSDILSSILVRFSGQVVIAPNTGTVRTTSRWPYDLLKAVRFTANGASSGTRLASHSAKRSTNDAGTLATMAWTCPDDS